MPKRLTVTQRDRMLDRIDRWWLEERKAFEARVASSPSWFIPISPREVYCRNMRSRLQRFIAGVKTGEQWVAAGEAIEAQRRAGMMTGVQYAERLKWLGLREWGAERTSQRRAA